MTKINVSVIIPTIENENVDHTILHYIDQLNRIMMEDVINKYEILVMPQPNLLIEDDRTERISKSLKQEYYHSKIIRIIEVFQRGKGYALQCGIEQAKYDWCLLIDDDMEYPINGLRDMVEHTLDHDLIIGSRIIKGGKRIDVPFIRLFYSWGFRFLCKLLFRFKTKDVQSGLKLVNKKLCDFKYTQFGYLWDTELIWNCELHDIVIKEVPITYK